MSDPAMNSGSSNVRDSAPPVALVPHLDADGRLTSNYLCVVCNYDLTGLSYAGACTECGHPVLGSLSRHLIALADARWLKSVGSGLHWFGPAAIAAFVFHFVGLGMIVTRSADMTMYTFELAMILARIPPSLLLIYSVFLITDPDIRQLRDRGQSPEPRCKPEYWGQTSRMLIVIASIISLLSSAVTGVAIFMQGWAVDFSKYPWLELARFGTTISPWLLLAGLLVMLHFVVSLSKRLPGSSGERSMAAASNVLALSVSFILFLLAGGILLHSARNEDAFLNALILLGIGTLIALIFFTGAARMLIATWKFGSQLQALAAAR